jgi:hypothetical protein
MERRFICHDRYEAKKLASLIFIKEGNETFIHEILNVIGNELIISIKDKSAHSVLFKDNEQVELFVDFIQSVIEKEHKIISTKVFDNEVEVSKG